MAKKETENKGAEKTAPNPSQGEGAQTNLVDHVVTEADIKHSPELAEKGIKVGDTVQIPAEAKEKADARAEAGNGGKSDEAKAAKYIVVSPFADRDNFSKMWQEGDDVSHFDEKRIADCLKRGLVKKG